MLGFLQGHSFSGCPHLKRHKHRWCPRDLNSSFIAAPMCCAVLSQVAFLILQDTRMSKMFGPETPTQARIPGSLIRQPPPPLIHSNDSFLQSGKKKKKLIFTKVNVKISRWTAKQKNLYQETSLSPLRRIYSYTIAPRSPGGVEGMNFFFKGV